MINIEVVMEEKGRDAMALLTLMIGLSDCCNGLGCQGQWFTECRASDAAWRGKPEISASMFIYNALFSVLQSQVWLYMLNAE